MKVLVYSTFSKRKFMKKMKSPSSMRSGRFHPPKCIGKLQKMGMMYMYFPNFLITSIKNEQKLKNCKKRRGGGPIGEQPIGSNQQLAVVCFLHAGSPN
jgi:hypothetical protein